MTTKLIGSALGVAGLVLLAVYVNWQAALAVFLMLAGNNLERH